MQRGEVIPLPLCRGDGIPIISHLSSLERLGRGGLEGVLDNIALADLGRSASGSSCTARMLPLGLPGSITSFLLAAGLAGLAVPGSAGCLLVRSEEGVRGFIPGLSLSLLSDLVLLPGVIPLIGVSTRHDILLLSLLRLVLLMLERGCCMGGLEYPSLVQGCSLMFSIVARFLGFARSSRDSMSNAAEIEIQLILVIIKCKVTGV